MPLGGGQEAGLRAEIGLCGEEMEVTLSGVP